MKHDKKNISIDNTKHTNPAPNSWEANQEDRLITETQLAAKWQVSVKKIQKDRCMGTGLPAIYIGRCVRYSLKAAIEYEKAHTFSSTTEAQHD